MASSSLVPASPPLSDPLRSLLRATHLLPPDRLASAVAETARLLGAVEAVVYLADYEQLQLHPLPGLGVAPRQALTVDGSVAGRAFRKVQVVRTPGADGRARVWLPLLDGVTRLGVLELALPVDAAATGVVEASSVATAEIDGMSGDAGPFAALVAEMLVNGDSGSDLFARLRRRKTLSLAAEIQWELLPPLAFATDRVVIAGGLEPAYDIGGDTFDYAVNGPTVDLAVLDAVGHGLPAALLASAAIGTYRHARRNKAELPDIAVEMDAVISGQFPDSRFATAALARLDLDSGRMRWVNAGHPAPLLIRSGVLIRPPACPPSRPLGLLAAKPVECEVQLQPGIASSSTPTGSLKLARPAASTSANSGWLTSSPALTPLETPLQKRFGGSCAVCSPTRRTSSRTTPASCCSSGAPAKRPRWQSSPRRSTTPDSRTVMGGHSRARSLHVNSLRVAGRQWADLLPEESHERLSDWSPAVAALDFSSACYCCGGPRLGDDRRRRVLATPSAASSHSRRFVAEPTRNRPAVDSAAAAHDATANAAASAAPTAQTPRSTQEVESALLEELGHGARHAHVVAPVLSQRI